MAIRIGPGVGTPVVFLSPGVLNTEGSPTSISKAGSIAHLVPVTSAAAQGPPTHASISIPNLVTEDAAVSYGLGRDRSSTLRPR